MPPNGSATAPRLSSLVVECWGFLAAWSQPLQQQLGRAKTFSKRQCQPALARADHHRSLPSPHATTVAGA